MVLVLLANGFEEIEALAFTDVLRRAEIEVNTVSITDERIVKGSHGIPVLADYVIDDINTALIDALVLPGGMPGTLNLQASNKVNELINYSVDNQKLIGAICAAPMVLGELGLLNGKNATCYPGFEDKLIGANPTGNRVEKDGIFITSKGAGTTSDFAHCFVKELKNEEIADTIISSMQY